jgi:hypothetical protein
MRALGALCLLGAAIALFPACGSSPPPLPEVLLPPRVDLRSYGTIALVQFSANVEGGGIEQARHATQAFLEAVQYAQPGVPILELGEEKEVLRAVQSGEWNPEAARAVGGRHGVEALLTGRLDLSNVKPSASIARYLTSVRIQAEIEGTLSVRLLDTKSGATLWSSSAHHRAPVAHASLRSDGPVRVGASRPADSYQKVVDALVYELTADFRPQYESR